MRMNALFSRRKMLACGVGGVAGLAAGASAVKRSWAASSGAVPPACGWQKRGVVLAPSERWERDGIQSFTSAAEPIDGDRWRIWYSAHSSAEGSSVAFAEGVPGEPMEKVRAECSAGEPADGPLSIGGLPDTWKPTQPVHLRLASGKHRLYFWASGRGVHRYLAADSDDGRRYRVVDPHRPVLYHFLDRAAAGVASPDGVMLNAKPSAGRPADEPAAPSFLISNDATNVYQLADGSFEMYSVGVVAVPSSDPAYIAEDNMPGLLRVIDRYISDDGLHFGQRQRVIARDAQDPVDQQFYYLSVTHTPQGRVGMLGHYRCEAQTMDVEWCFSTDGLRWERPQRTAWLGRGEPSQPDSYGIYANAGLVPQGGSSHLFYTGVNESHNQRDSYGPPLSVIMHATIDSIGAGS